MSIYMITISSKTLNSFSNLFTLEFDMTTPSLMNEHDINITSLLLGRADLEDLKSLGGGG
jgi:hypothetical protein